MQSLFVYGTLCPNRENAHILQPIQATWQKGCVRGVVHTLDWGPDQGLPAAVLDQDENQIAGYLFTPQDLNQHLPMLDEFEGFQYKRVATDVELDNGQMVCAWIYVMNEQAKSHSSL